MPASSLSDAFGFKADGSLAEGATFLSALPKFAHLKDIPLDQVPIDQTRADLTFAHPISVAAGGLTLEIGGGAGGSLALIGSKMGELDDRDPFRPVAIKPGEIYVALGLNFSTMAGASVAAGVGAFGFTARRGMQIQCYRCFKAGAGGFPAFSKAMADTVSSIYLPRTAADLDQISSEAVLVFSGGGSLSVSAAFTVETPVSTIASANLAPGKSLDVNISGSFETEAKVTITGGYRIRLRRLGLRKIELGVFKLAKRELDVTVAAEAGVTAGAGNFDLASKFIAALSRKHPVDPSEFRQALPGEDPAAREQQIAIFETSLKEAISTKIQASVSAVFTALHSDKAAWLFEVDLDAATSDAAQAALTAALQGDFRALTADPERLPAGIAQTSNVLTAMEVRKQRLQINLLGILNFVSVTSLARISAVERNSGGEITLITDTSSVRRLEALLLNAGVNAKRLRQMLSENFLIEAAYQASRLGVLPPEFKSRHTYLEIHDRTSRDQMKDNLDVFRVLGVLTPDEEESRLSKDNFGRTTFYVETRYTTETVRRIFLDRNDNPRTVEDFENAGRSALGALLAGDADPGFRAKYTLGIAGGDELWSEMKRLGNVAVFAPLFGLPAGSSDPRVAAAGSDYITITTWASAMNQAGAAIREIDHLFAGGLVDTGDARLTDARDRLQRRMAEVVKDTHDHFGDPLGLVMVYIASGEDAEKHAIMSGEGIEALEKAAGA